LEARLGQGIRNERRRIQEIVPVTKMLFGHRLVVPKRRANARRRRACCRLSPLDKGDFCTKSHSKN
jgi:hypothetical protein